MLETLAGAPLLVKVHLTAAVLAIGLGLVQLLAPKGTVPHRTLGWTWVGLVAIVVLSSLFMHRAVPGMPALLGFSPIHLFTVAAAVGLPLGVLAARRKDVLTHRSLMTAVFAGALIIAGLFSVSPGRLLYDMFAGKRNLDGQTTYAAWSR